MYDDPIIFAITDILVTLYFYYHFKFFNIFMNTIIKYILFSFISMLINIISQRIIFTLNSSEHVFTLAIITGTITGFISKYYFDKNFVFKDKTLLILDKSKQILKYAYFAVFTTLIFLTTEYLFWIIYNTHSAREIGAVIGLSIGYYLKYILDKKYVFNQPKT